eukprot:6947032-Prymnesium_polylepis.2
MLTRSRLVVRVVRLVVRLPVGGALFQRGGGGGEQCTDVKRAAAHIHIQSHGSRRHDRAVLRIAVVALTISDALAVSRDMAVVCAIGDCKPRWWLAGRRGNGWRRGR